MIDRYSRAPMKKIWSMQNQYQTWLDVEIAIDEAWNQQGMISDAEIKKIQDNATFDVDKIAEIEKETHHDIVAFTRNVSESLGPEKRWIHYGITSTDVVDTAQGLRLKQANQILRSDIEMLMETIKKWH